MSGAGDRPPILVAGLERLAVSRRTLEALLEDIPPESFCHQPVEGGNHAMWIVGHLAATDEFFRATLAQSPPTLGERWREHFGTGSKPEPALDAYPPVSEVLEAFRGRRRALLEVLEALDGERLGDPLDPPLDRFATSLGDLPASLAWHEGWHTGQVSMIRRSLGHPPKFG